MNTLCFTFHFQNYQASVDDLRKVLCIDPNVAEAKKELEEITQFLNPNVTTSSQQKQRKKIKIHEVFPLL